MALMVFNAIANIIVIVLFVLLVGGAIIKARRAKQRAKQLAEVTEFIKKIGLVGDQPTMPDECECGQKHSTSGVTPWYVELGPDGHD